MTLPDELSPPLIAVAVALLLLLALAAGFPLWRRHRARRALLSRIEAVAPRYLKDVLLPDGNGGWFHVDFLLLTGIGVVVVDLRDVPGIIFGSEPMNEWTVMHKQKRSTFPNPLGPMYDRVAVVRALAGDGVPVEGRIVFNDGATFPKGQPKMVTRLGSLASELPPLSSSDAMMERLAPAWERLEAAASPSALNRR